MSVSRRPRTARTRIAIAAAIVIGLLLPAAAAGEVKPYSVVVSPESVAAGRQAVLAATVVNGSAQQQLGSVNLTAPAGFTLVGASLPGSAEGSATVRGSVVELRDLSLPPGGSLQVDLSVDVGCAAGQYAWAVVAKQANRFNGPPGNDFVLDAARSSLTTTVTGGCSLRFFTQPQDARVGERLTGTDFDPAGAPVAVEVVGGDGERVASAALDQPQLRDRRRSRDVARHHDGRGRGRARGVRRPQRRRARDLPPARVGRRAAAGRLRRVHDPAGGGRVRGGRRLRG